MQAYMFTASLLCRSCFSQHKLASYDSVVAAAMPVRTESEELLHLACRTCISATDEVLFLQNAHKCH